MNLPPTHELHNAAQREYYGTRRLPRMDPTKRSSSTYTQRHISEVMRSLDLRPTDRICDVGCGPGKYTVGLSGRGFDIEGLDLTPRLVDELSAASGGSIPAHLGDICDPPAELQGRFSAVVGFMMLHHVDDLASALRGVFRLLQPGGRAAFLEPNPLYPGYYVQIAFTPGMRWREERGILQIRPKVIQELALSAGFRETNARNFGAFPPMMVNAPGGRSAEHFLERIPGWTRAKAFQILTMHRPK
jgi:2-polyprenyl-3-methyl-5-hydroxy-6-metoxy-1,4-benzoquinol methylase